MDPATHYKALGPMEKEAFIGLLAKGLAAAGRWAAPKLFRGAATAAAKAAPAIAGQAATKAPGILSKINDVMAVGPANAASYIGKKMGGTVGAKLEQAGNWGTTKFGDRAGFAKNWTPQGVLQTASWGGMLPLVGGPSIPGMETLNNIAYPGFTAAAAGVEGLANGVKGGRMMGAGNQAAFANDVRTGADAAKYGLTSAAMQDPKMFNPEYLSSQLGGPMQQRINGINSGQAPNSGSWNHLKQFFGGGEGDFTTSMANDAVYGSGQLKQAGIMGTLGHMIMPAMVAAPLAGAFMGKPYDAAEAQQTGVAAGAAGFQKAIGSMSPTERFFAKMDPTLAVAGADKASPGFASGYADWHRQNTGEDFHYGPMASIYNAWNGSGTTGPSDPKAPQKYYINSSMNLPAYLA